MTKSLDFKMDVIMNIFASLSHRFTDIEGVTAGLHNDGASVITPSTAYQTQHFEEVNLPSMQ